MRVNRDLLGWGVFLIVLGSVPLAVRAGYLDSDLVRRAWELWPLILVGIGLGLMLRRTRAAIVGGLVVAVTFGLIGGSLLAVGIGGAITSCGVGVGSGAGTPFETRTGSLDAAGTVTLALDCGELKVSPATGSAWSLTGNDEDGKGPDIQSANDRLRVRSPDRSGVALTRRGDRWQVALPADPSLRLDVSLNAGSATLDLAGMHVPTVNLSVNAGEIRADLSRAAQVGQLDASANAGSLRISLPAASVTGSISANAGSVALCAPSDVGLRFRGSDDPLSSNNFGSRGLVQNGRTWTTPGFDAATIRIDLAVSANLGSITLNPEVGCG